jgi:hypothetical protein
MKRRVSVTTIGGAEWSFNTEPTGDRDGSIWLNLWAGPMTGCVRLSIEQAKALGNNLLAAESDAATGGQTFAPPVNAELDQLEAEGKALDGDIAMMRSGSAA